jgi:MPBQ/MSBQ methyltransferase
MTFENDVARHYARPALEEKIIAALEAAGKNPGQLTPEDLAPVDEFHVGGRQATIDLADRLELQEGMALIDIGCGLGGASRYFAQARGCIVQAVDLTPDFVQVAEALANRVGLASRVSYQQASALNLPFEPRRFDRATLMHVGMNIADKRQLFLEVGRVLKADGLFGIYDIMRVAPGEISYPVPWTSAAATSFVSSPEEYRVALEATGFTIVSERNRSSFGLSYFESLQRQTAAQGVSPLGLHIAMGETAVRQMVNIYTNIKRGVVAPVELICKFRST